MGAPVPEMNPVEDASAEALLSSLRTIAAAERRKHASVFNYWLSIRRDRQFPPIRDLDPLEISDAGPYSILLEMIGGGEDAEIRHIGQAIKDSNDVAKVGDAPNPSLLSCIASRLPVVAACREAFAFEDRFETAEGKTRCWVTLLPFSATGTWIDYVYGFVSLDSPTTAAVEPEAAEEALEPLDETASDDQPEPSARTAEPGPVEELVEPEPVAEPEATIEAQAEPEPEPIATQAPVESTGKAGFSKKFFESLANGFYGRPTGVDLDLDTARLETGGPSEPVTADETPEPEPVIEQTPEPVAIEETPEPEPEPVAVEEELEVEPEPVAIEEATEIEPEPVAFEEVPESEPEELVAAEEITPEAEPVAIEEPPEIEPEILAAEEPVELELSTQAISKSEGTLQSKLTEVRTRADEARQAKLRANVALYEGLSAAYDFALDAEDAPEEYLRLVEAQGLKIQLRSPMKPVVKLAFEGMCDDATIKQLEAILAWAFDEELPRGSLAGRIEEAGGIGPILSGEKRAA